MVCLDVLPMRQLCKTAPEERGLGQVPRTQRRLFESVKGLEKYRFAWWWGVLESIKGRGIGSFIGRFI